MKNMKYMNNYVIYMKMIMIAYHEELEEYENHEDIEELEKHVL